MGERQQDWEQRELGGYGSGPRKGLYHVTEDVARNISRRF